MSSSLDPEAIKRFQLLEARLTGRSSRSPMTTRRVSSGFSSPKPQISQKNPHSIKQSQHSSSSQKTRSSTKRCLGLPTTNANPANDGKGNNLMNPAVNEPSSSSSPERRGQKQVEVLVERMVSDDQRDSQFFAPLQRNNSVSKTQSMEQYQSPKNNINNNNSREPLNLASSASNHGRRHKRKRRSPTRRSPSTGRRSPIDRRVPTRTMPSKSLSTADQITSTTSQALKGSSQALTTSNIHTQGQNQKAKPTSAGNKKISSSRRTTTGKKTGGKKMTSTSELTSIAGQYKYRFSNREDQKIMEGYYIYKNDWNAVKNHGGALLAARSPSAVRSRFKEIQGNIATAAAARVMAQKLEKARKKKQKRLHLRSSRANNNNSNRESTGTTLTTAAADKKNVHHNQPTVSKSGTTTTTTVNSTNGRSLLDANESNLNSNPANVKLTATEMLMVGASVAKSTLAWVPIHPTRSSSSNSHLGENHHLQSSASRHRRGGGGRGGFGPGVGSQAHTGGRSHSSSNGGYKDKHQQLCFERGASGGLLTTTTKKRLKQQQGGLVNQHDLSKEEGRDLVTGNDVINPAGGSNEVNISLATSANLLHSTASRDQMTTNATMIKPSQTLHRYFGGGRKSKKPKKKKKGVEKGNSTRVKTTTNGNNNTAVNSTIEKKEYDLTETLKENMKENSNKKDGMKFSDTVQGHNNAAPGSSGTTQVSYGQQMLEKQRIEYEKKIKGVQEVEERTQRELSMARGALRASYSEQEKLKKKLLEVKHKHEYQRTLALNSVETLIREKFALEAKQIRQKLATDAFRLGKVITERVPMGMGMGRNAGYLQEVWENGYGFTELRIKKAELAARKNRLVQQKKQRNRRIKALGGEKRLNDAQRLAVAEKEEVFRLNFVRLRREEHNLEEAYRSLESEKALHIRELKRVRDEDRSRFRDPTKRLLHGRYLLACLLGKGGFSEVWKAYDLKSHQSVAVKVHALNSSWSEAKKQNYTKHATREYNIHKSLYHPRIVRLLDVFEIDRNSFATVLEYCEGTDLDRRLKEEGKLPELEARSILIQILSGLLYLNGDRSQLSVDDMIVQQENASSKETGSAADTNTKTNGGAGGEQETKKSHTHSTTNGNHSETMSDQSYNQRNANRLSSPTSATGAVNRNPPSIIHYDLKPGNILFDISGCVKITDFGLSKIMDDEACQGGTSMELTSQGAGTYWYLPPECFQQNVPPKISSKVDVWSIGVIYFQMLFGVRPFGEGMSQDKYFAHAMGERVVKFPAKIQVSESAKAFIRKCLTHNQAQRPDVRKLCSEKYLTDHKAGVVSKKKKS
eukprot:g768.t1